MCESSAWLLRGEDDEELLLEDVILLKPAGSGFVLTNILGEKKEIEAELDRIDLLHHRILLKPAGRKG